jgi:hypothetical protein
MPPGPKKPFDTPDPPVPNIVGPPSAPRVQISLGTLMQTAKIGSLPMLMWPSEAVNGQLEKIAQAIMGLTTHFDMSQLETREKMEELHRKFTDLSDSLVIACDTQVQRQSQMS